jgi:hypothetical protein
MNAQGGDTKVLWHNKEKIIFTLNHKTFSDTGQICADRNA